RSAAIEGGVVECPFRGRDLPDELRKLVAVFFATGATTVGGEGKPIRPFEYGLRWRWYLPPFLAVHHIATNRHHRIETSKNINNINTLNDFSACGGLNPDPAIRVRGAHPHLSCPARWDS